jgi:hypothetical protein
MNARLAMIDVGVLAPVLAVVGLVVLFVAIPLFLLRWWRRGARRAGYPDLRSYLRAIPRTDAERRAAVEMTLRGLVLCLLGIPAPVLLLIGVFPLYYGARKVALAWLGLDMVEDGSEEPA